MAVNPVQVKITPLDIEHPHCQELINELQQDLATRYESTGDSAEWDPTEFRQPHGQFFVAWLGATPAGCAGIRPTVDHIDPNLHPAHELKRMYVRPTARKQGIAKLLLQTCEQQARTQGSRHLVLISGAKQPESLALYQNAGYQPTAPFGPYANSTLVRPLMKRLQKTKPANELISKHPKNDSISRRFLEVTVRRLDS